MQKCLSILFLLMGIILGACTTNVVDDLVQQQADPPMVITRPLLSPTAQQITSLEQTESSTRIVSVITSTPKITQTTIISETVIPDPDIGPILVATIQPDPYRRTFMPENVWWSGNSQTLYYQDIEKQQAWAYEVSTRISIPIDYVPRSLRELEPQIHTTLPTNASLVSISPHHHHLLYRIPLPEPIPISDNPELEPTPEVWVTNSYTAELWLRKEGQDFNLGLVDDCFGILFPPLWSENENIVTVSTAGAVDIACLYSVWLINLDTLFLGPLHSRWTENYRVLDLSSNGNMMLVHSYTDHLNYLYNTITKDVWVIPTEDTDRMTLVETGQFNNCLIFQLEFSETILRDLVWYCEPIIGKLTFLTAIVGQISQGVISPNKKFIAFVVDNDFPQGNFYEDVIPSIWLLALP